MLKQIMINDPYRVTFKYINYKLINHKYLNKSENTPPRMAIENIYYYFNYFLNFMFQRSNYSNSSKCKLILLFLYYCYCI